MAYRDLREWLDQVDAIGELARVKGAHWDLEANAVASLTNKAVEFDEFPGYPKGYRVLSWHGKQSPKRVEIATGFKSESEGTLERVKDLLAYIRTYKPCPPVEVKSGPIAENVITGKDVDILRFPVPRRHAKEANRAIGTCHTNITRDPDTGRINLGTYRMQVFDNKSAGFHASEGKDGRIIMDKYHRRGQACPSVAVVGLDEALFTSSTAHLLHQSGDGELDFAGWLKGYPEEFIVGEHTGLPIPARAEIALEGEIRPGVKHLEGPFAEWTGYSQVIELPVFEVKAIYHRNNPIMTCAMGKGFNPDQGLKVQPLTSALVWDQMEKAGVRGIKGVAYYGRRLRVISIDNQYAGQSMQAALIAGQCHAGAYGGTYTIVVDGNIDPTKFEQVMWHVFLRSEPKRAIQILEHCWGSHLTIQDPSQVQKADYAMRPEKATYVSQAIIDGCVPLEWDPSWHEEIRILPEVLKTAKEKFSGQL